MDSSANKTNETSKINRNEPNRTCGRCGVKFRCGIEAGDTVCWCFELPHVMPMQSDENQYNGCLCPECLREMIAMRASMGDESLDHSE